MAFEERRVISGSRLSLVVGRIVSPLHRLKSHPPAPQIVALFGDRVFAEGTKLNEVI